MGKCKDCPHPNCPKCGTTHPMSECDREKAIKNLEDELFKLRYEEMNSRIKAELSAIRNR